MMDAKVKAWNSPETHQKKWNTENNRKSEITSTRTLESQRRVIINSREEASKTQYRDFRASSFCCKTTRRASTLSRCLGYTSNKCDRASSGLVLTEPYSSEGIYDPTNLEPLATVSRAVVFFSRAEVLLHAVAGGSAFLCTWDVSTFLKSASAHV